MLVVSVCAGVSFADDAPAAPDYAKNQYSHELLTPPDYETFRPPPAGETFKCPVFGTEIRVLSDHHGVVGWNGERSHFSIDDKYFVVGVKPGRGKDSEVWLYDGRTGAFIKSIPIAGFDNTRWGYDPKVLFHFKDRQVRGYNVETGEDTLVREFDEPVRLCGGDGNDFDDKGEWILLNCGKKAGLRMFPFNVRTGQAKREWDSLAPKADVDYATVTPSGKYVAVLGRGRNASLENPHSGTGIYDLDGRFIRQLAPFHSHVDFGYVNGTDECIIMKGYGPGYPAWCKPRGLGLRDMLAISFATGKTTKLTDGGSNYIQTAAVGGSNRRYLYLAYEAGNHNPERKWDKYLGEIVEIPLDGSLRVRRLLHHRARSSVNRTHTWADQPELWINHAGDRLFFRSNMALMQGATQEKYGHDLFMIKIPPR
ncbi:MAG: hypothetical protein JXR37_11945 [Kiritimatiellae bacterium]|nr:hypothetical protein [Kiritimatiellia bacterium]